MGTKVWNRWRYSMGRGIRTALNLVLVLVLAWYVWALYGYPLPTLEMEFRRLERTCLYPPSDIVFNSDKLGTVEEAGRPSLTMRDDMVVGVVEDRVSVARIDKQYSQLYTYPLTDGPTPIPLYQSTAILFRPGDVEAALPLLFLDVPQAHRVQLEIAATDWNGNQLDYRGEGWNLGGGVWMFATKPGNSFVGSWYQGGSYTLELYDQGGNLLSQWQGELPPEP